MFPVFTAQLNSDNEMRQGDRKIVLEISEHDASRLLALIQQETRRAEKAWRSYWQRMAKQIEHSVEQAGLEEASLKQPSILLDAKKDNENT